jgi:two-component system, cell cycle sensor histidine kinase and response regulator CckA
MSYEQLNLYDRKLINKGTIFKILIPASDELMKIDNIDNNTILKKSNATILLVDDEDIIRETGKLMLEEIGYRIILAENGNTAINIYKNKKKY